MVAVAKMVTIHHFSHKNLSENKQQITEGTSLSQLPEFSTKKAVIQLF